MIILLVSVLVMHNFIVGVAVTNAHTDLLRAERAWSNLNNRIKKKYHAEGEIEYSRDFKAVIPKTTSGTSAWRDWCLGGTPCETRSGMIPK